MPRIRVGAVGSIAALAAVVCTAQVTITEYPVTTPSSFPAGIAAGPDGNLWFTEANANQIGRITPGGVVTEFTAAGGPLGITAGPDGNMWFAEQQGNKIGKITPAGMVTEFSIPTAGSYPSFIRTGLDGNLWFTEEGGNKIGRITPAGTITEFPVSTSAPYGITLGPDGNMWFAEEAGAIGRITTAGVLTEFPVAAGSVPIDVAAGPDGNIWFVELIGKIGKITNTGMITEYPIPTPNSAPQGITKGPDGNLWFAEYGQNNGNNIRKITTSGVITEFPTPTGASAPFEITAGADGNVWFTEGIANQIGKVSLDILGPVMSNVSITPDPLAVNTGSSLTAAVSDSTTGGGNIASAYYSINGGPALQMLLTPGMAVTAQASASLAPFSQSNVYNVCVRGTDLAGNTGAEACIPLPVYDPTGGFVTGGGQVGSPAGADLLNPSAVGPATFGFVSKYLPGRNIPSGNLEFHFKNGNLDFKSTSMDWLVVTGEPRAKFHGTGTINGANVCDFEVDAWAGSFTGNVDAFGLKITSCSDGGDRYILPATALTHGSIIIHK